MGDRIDEYLTVGLFDDLRRSTANRPSPSVCLAELWAAALSAEFSEVVDFLAAQPSFATPELGEFLAFPAVDFVPPTSNTFAFMLAQPFRRAALFTQTVTLGCTGSGDTWLFEVAAPNRVFLHDHDTGVLEPAADSVASFAWLCRLHEASATADEDWQLLAGRVRGSRDLSVPPTVASWSSDGVLEARLRAARDLAAALDHGAHFEVHEAPIDRSSVSGLIASALRLFLREDPGLTALLPELTAHPARLAKDAATVLKQRSGHRTYEARLRSLGTLPRAS